MAGNGRYYDEIMSADFDDDDILFTNLRPSTTTIISSSSSSAVVTPPQLTTAPHPPPLVGINHPHGSPGLPYARDSLYLGEQSFGGFFVQIYFNAWKITMTQ